MDKEVCKCPIVVRVATDSSQGTGSKLALPT